jgi:hypothetical protein
MECNKVVFPRLCYHISYHLKLQNSVVLKLPSISHCAQKILCVWQAIKIGLLAGMIRENDLTSKQCKQEFSFLGHSPHMDSCVSPSGTRINEE